MQTVQICITVQENFTRKISSIFCQFGSDLLIISIKQAESCIYQTGIIVVLIFIYWLRTNLGFLILFILRIFIFNFSLSNFVPTHWVDTVTVEPHDTQGTKGIAKTGLKEEIPWNFLTLFFRSQLRYWWKTSVPIDPDKSGSFSKMFGRVRPYTGFTKVTKTDQTGVDWTAHHLKP